MAVGAVVDLNGLIGRQDLVDATVVVTGDRRLTVRAVRPGGSPVAVKIGVPLPSRRARRQFLSESSVLLRLPPSPFVVPVLDAGLGPENRPWLAAPWLSGGSLAERLGRDGPLPVDALVSAGADAAAGLVALHSQGVLHANLKPSNLLCEEDRTLLDGIALPSLAPAAAHAGGAPSHVPPEVLEGGAWTRAGDVWALGSCLHALLTGEPPWAREAGGGISALVLAMATSGPPPLHRIDIPGWLAELVASCLAVDPDARPDSPEAVESRLRRAQPDRALTLAPSPRQEVEGRPLGSSYLLIEPIGAGASGQVWRGRRRWDDSAVAVKVLRPELSADAHAVARFLRERTTLVGLDHPNLVRVLDLVAEGGVLAIVMELVEGSDLRTFLRSHGPMPIASAAPLLAQIAAGLDAIHRAGIVHRDLKPENVLVQGPERPGASGAPSGVPGPERPGASGAPSGVPGPAPTPHVRLTDFGIARPEGGTAVTGADQLLGTAEYLAPELVAGRPLTPAADIYSFGVVAYELLSGRRPFEGPHPAAVLRAHLDAAPPPLASPVWDLVAACLAKDPAARPTAAWVARAMSDGPPPAAVPAVEPPAPGGAPEVGTAPFESPLRRPASPDRGGGTSPVRRRRRWWLVAASVLVIAAAGAGVAVGLTGSGRSQPPSEATADVTASVTAAGNGAVRLTWPDVSTFSGFQTYLLLQDGRAVSTQPVAPATAITLDGVPPGEHCFRVAAAFQGALPAHLPRPNLAKECVTVP